MSRASGSPLRDPRLWGAALLFGAITLMWTTYNRYVPGFLRETFGLPAVVVVAVLTLDNALGFVLEPLSGAFSDRFGRGQRRRVAWVLIFSPLAVAFFALLPIPPLLAPSGTLLSPFALLVVGMLVTMALFRTPAVTIMPDLAAPPDRVSANALLQALGALGALGAVYFGDWLIGRYGIAAPFFVAGAVMIVTALLMWALLGGDRPEPERERYGDRVAAWPARGAMVGAIALWWLGFLILNARLGPLASGRWGFESGALALLEPLLLLAVALLAIPIGQVAEPTGRRRLLVVATVVLIMGSVVLPLLPGILGVALVAVTLLGAGWATVLVAALPMLLAMGSEARLGTSTGLYFLAFALAGLVTPWLLRSVVPVLGDATLWLVPLCWLGALALLFVLPPDSGEVTPLPG